MNKTSKIICIIFTAVFVLAALVPLAGMIFTGGRVNDAEQRTPASFPEIVADGKLNLDFGSGFEDWFADRFALRSELADANGKAMLSIFGTSPEDSVVAGKDSWLFYADTVADYLREERLTDAELQRLVNSIKLESDYVRSIGGVYVFAAAPNKNSIYPEMMGPLFSQNEGNSLLERLNAALASEGVMICDLKQVLTDNKTSGQLYYTGDSHWNLYGSIFVRDALLEKIGSAAGINVSGDGRAKETLSDGEREDDLLKMVRPGEPKMFERFSNDSSAVNYKVKGRMASLDDMLIETSCEGTPLRLLMFRDSFGRALIQPLANTFSEAVFTRGVPFDIYGKAGLYDGELRTVVVREIVERNLTDLLKNAPVVPAPSVAEGSEVLKSMTCCEKEMISVEKGTGSHGLVRICGIARGVDDSYSRVIVKAGGVYYEAFPFCDASSDLREEAGCGFTLWIVSESDVEIEAVYAG